MRKEAITAGFYKSERMREPIEKIKIVTIEQILAGERLHIPFVAEVLKQAQKAKEQEKSLFE